jgi:TolB-like protein
MSLYHELKRRNVLRVAIAYLAGSWLLIEVTETVFPLFGFDDTLARIVVILLAIGFPLFLLFSWVFEITPGGLKKEKDIDRTASVTHKTGKHLDRIIIVLLALALGYFALDKFVLEPARVSNLVEETAQQARSKALVESYGDNSIAVLPFVNMSSDPEQEYFSDGVTEELLNLLSKIPNLRVTARTSSFFFKGKDMKVSKIAEALNVTHILEGSVRKAGSQVRITAQLIDTRSDTHLWSETYDRELENIFAIQDEISVAIVAALKERLGLEIAAIQSVTTVANTEAHDAYLRGRHLVVQRTATTISSAIREFERAVELDPDYALAHAELAMAILLLAYWEADLTLSERIAQASPHAELGLALDPDLAEAHTAIGFLLRRQGLENEEEAIAHYEQAIRLNPGYALPYYWMALAMNAIGDYAGEYRSVEMALQLDPLWLSAINYHNNVLILRNETERAHRDLEKIALIHPGIYVSGKGELAGVGGHWSNILLGDLEYIRIKRGRLFQYNARVLAIMGLEQEALAVPMNSSSEELRRRVWVLNLLGRPEDVLIRDEDTIAESTGTAGHQFGGWELAAAGEYARARPLLEDNWLQSGGRVTKAGTFTVNQAAALIATRRAAGDEAGVNEIIEAIRDDVRRFREAGYNGTKLFISADYEEGLAAFFAGERERGLALITKAADDGYFILPNAVYLQELYDDPGFAPIRADQEARRARERNKFLANVCTDNPYEEVWQPAEGTCERFAVEGGN